MVDWSVISLVLGGCYNINDYHVGTTQVSSLSSFYFFYWDSCNVVLLDGTALKVIGLFFI